MVCKQSFPSFGRPFRNTEYILKDFLASAEVALQTWLSKADQNNPDGIIIQHNTCQAQDE